MFCPAAYIYPQKGVTLSNFVAASLFPGVYLDRYDKYNIPMTQLREQDDVGARQRRLKEQFGLAIMQVRPPAGPAQAGLSNLQTVQVTLGGLGELQVACVHVTAISSTHVFSTLVWLWQAWCSDVLYRLPAHCQDKPKRQVSHKSCVCM